MILTIKSRLIELKSLQLPKMSFDDIRCLTNVEYSIEELKYINIYLSNFVKLETDNCICCGRKNFQWGIMFGVAECVNCGWECVVAHVINDNKEKIILQMDMPLQYHPDVYEIKDV